MLKNRSRAIVMHATRLNDRSSALSRRDFLVLSSKIWLALSGLLGLGGILRFLSSPSEESPATQFDLGPVDQFPVGTRKALPKAQAVLLHTPQGFTAFSTACPHLGCTVNEDENGFTCPCHGSQFEGTGGLRRGPAKSSLQELRLEVNEQGSLILYAH
jgi:cytochrome b6-f complex iron-sulfur subunit